MKKKRLILVAIEATARDQYLSILQDFFRDALELTGYYANGQQIPAHLDCDLVLYTSQDLVSIIRPRIAETTNLLLLRRVVIRENLRQLDSYPPGTNAILFDYTEETAKYIIAQILDCGVHNISFTPLGRNSPPERLHHMAEDPSWLLVMMGLDELVTISMPATIDLGWTGIDPNQLLEIAILLHCKTEHLEQRLLKYVRLTSNASHGILYFLRTTMESQSRYQTVVELLEDGILVYRKDGGIIHCNHAFANSFHLNQNSVIGSNLAGLSLPKTIKDDLFALRPIEDKWISGGSFRQGFMLSVYEISAFSEIMDYVAVIRSSECLQQHSAQLQRHLKNQGFNAKYTFDHILGVSPAVQVCRQMAGHISRVDGPVLITGETGTGKELFAQAIHNASPRSSMPFVAINCAALTPSLLESELFGYEAGAFTGSKAKGHTGLFECAHRGTIFLDEIGDLSMELQAKLLRVLEEREIRPVGSHRIVPIDVRIIAATNQDLFQRMEQKQFRADLFYRLSLFPLELPPLRERPEDILILARHFMEGLGGGFAMTPRLEEALLRLKWQGNIRELRNCVHYMTSTGHTLLDISALPPHYAAAYAPEGTKRDSQTLATCREEQLLIAAILRTLEDRAMSRSALTAALSAQGYAVSEYHVRLLLGRLRENEFLTYGAGRGGVRLTQKGYLAATTE